MTDRLLRQGGNSHSRTATHVHASTHPYLQVGQPSPGPRNFHAFGGHSPYPSSLDDDLYSDYTSPTNTYGSVTGTSTSWASSDFPAAAGYDPASTNTIHPYAGASATTHNPQLNDLALVGAWNVPTGRYDGYARSSPHDLHSSFASSSERVSRTWQPNVAMDEGEDDGNINDNGVDAPGPNEQPTQTSYPVVRTKENRKGSIESMWSVLNNRGSLP